MPTATSPPASRDALLLAHFVLAILLTMGVLLQAYLAATSERIGYGDMSITVHGMVANVVYLVAVGMLVVTIVARAPRGALIGAIAAVVLLTAQIGMGYVAESNATVGAIHIVNGVLLFGLAGHQIGQASALRKGRAAA